MIATDGAGETVPEGTSYEAGQNEFTKSTLTADIEGGPNEYVSDASNEASMHTFYYKTPQPVTGDVKPDESVTDTTKQETPE